MSALLNMQLRFSQSLMDNHDAIEPLLAETERPALAIYSHAYLVRFQETLSKDYPALSRLLGNDEFVSLADKYNRVHPSESYSLRTYGQYMADFLHADEHYSQQPYLAELAAFEWQLTDIFDIADTAVAKIEDMTVVPAEAWPVLSVKFQLSLRLLESHWNISDIYPALKKHTVMPDLIRHEHQRQYLIWRKSYSPHYRLLDTHEWLAIKTLENTNFSELCQILSDLRCTPDGASLQAATYLKSWLAAGLIESISYQQ